MSQSSRVREGKLQSSNDDETPFRLMLALLALSTIATCVGVLLATVVHI